jgi:formyltetrahydrofolate-dependent phosphoribosylglycinamide formyltransferase
MIKSNGLNKIKIAVFISGKGSNLENLIKFSKKKNSIFKISLVLSNNTKAIGLKFCKQYRIKKIINPINTKKNERILISRLKEDDIKFICLAGFMSILSKDFIKKFNGKILNIHPSLLPKYKGLNTHYRAIINKDKYSGCTVHFVNSKLDSGKIISQKKVKILKNDTIKSLEKRILKQEHILYPKALKKVLLNL